MNALDAGLIVLALVGIISGIFTLAALAVGALKALWDALRRPRQISFYAGHPPYRQRNVVSMARYRDRDWKVLR